MKRFCGYVFVSGLMLGSLLLQYDPASAWDTMAHFGSTSACSLHMTDPTHLGNPPQPPFYLCRGNSRRN